MIRESIRSSRSLALRVALGVVAAAGLAGCVASEPAAEDPLVENERVTQDQVASLEAGEFLGLEMVENKVYALDYSSGAIDYSRIKLSTSKGKQILLADQMAAVENADYGDLPPPVLTNSSEQRFSISADAASFGKLSAKELEQLKVDGYFYSETPPSATGAKPQTTDPECVHGFCEVCVDNDTGGHPETWLPGTFTCYLVEHEWCL